MPTPLQPLEAELQNPAKLALHLPLTLPLHFLPLLPCLHLRLCNRKLSTGPPEEGKGAMEGKDSARILSQRHSLFPFFRPGPPPRPGTEPLPL